MIKTMNINKMRLLTPYQYTAEHEKSEIYNWRGNVGK